MSHRTMTTGVIGTPATGLDAQGFNAGAAAAGVRGEHLTAQTLRDYSSDCLIAHSLRLPVKMNADIDHLIVAGNSLMAIDSKLWKPGYYHGWIGSPRRGLRTEAHLDVDASARAVSALESMLAADGLTPTTSRLVAVHPAKQKQKQKTTISTSLRWHTPPIVAATALATHIEDFLQQSGGLRADPELASAIKRIHQKGRSS